MTKNTINEDVINPSDIIFDDDTDMPVPETNNYQQNTDDSKNADGARILHTTLLFNTLFMNCMGKLPYASVLKNNNNEQIKLADLVKFIENKKSGMTVAEMNTIIGFIANCPFEHVRPLMDIITSNDQRELWTVE